MRPEAREQFASTEHYRSLRLKLVFYFDRRGCNCSEDLADECLYRVFVYHEKQDLPATLDRFTFGFAPKVYHEWLRHSSRFAPETDVSDRTSSPPREASRLMAEISVAQMEPSDRELMEQYYLDGRTADSLAAEWGLSAEGIRSRIFRKRRKLMNIIMAQKESMRETNPPSESIRG
jgi:DNA-directed RNA polymerase specialized sigma24 family protein